MTLPNTICTFESYRHLARRTRENGNHRPKEERVKHWTIGLTGEAGEVANVIKKHVCTKKFDVPTTCARVLDEAGDVLWYLDALLDEYGITLQQVAAYNIDKLAERHGVPAAEFAEAA